MLELHKGPYVGIDRDPDRVVPAGARRVGVLLRHDADRAAAALAIWALRALWW
jgi:hypothetical protein